MDELKGYKAFHKGLINRYGEQFEVGKTYKVDGLVKFGNQGNGFHFCTNLEDTLRYVPAKEEVVICEVTLRRKIMIMDDEYNGFYDIGAAQEMTIERIIPRDEILKMFLDINKKLPLERVRRFIQLFRLTDNEIEMFKLRYLYDDLTLKYIAYYQENDYNAFFVNSKLQTFKKTRFAGKTPNTIKSNNNE